MSTDTQITRKFKLDFIGFPTDKDDSILTDEDINNMYKKCADEKNKELTGKPKQRVVRIKKQKHEKVSIDSDKYKVTMVFLNDLLEAMNKNKIEVITEFKNVDRKELLTDACNTVMNKHITDIIKHFGKTKICYYRRAEIDHYILTLIKYLTSLCGYQFVSANSVNYTKNAPGDHICHRTILYSIV